MTPEKYVNSKKVRKCIPEWKIGRKWLMHENKRMWCSLCAEHMRKLDTQYDGKYGEFK